QCFFLQDHPFTPTKDPKSDFDFLRSNASLMSELDVFAHQPLLTYFTEVGGFGGAIEQTRDFLQRIGYPYGGAPVILIAGSKGAGRSSTANYVARLMSERSPQPLAVRRADLGGSDNKEKQLFL